MATKNIACGHIGIVWQGVLSLWDDYAAGTYIAWSFAVGSGLGYWNVQVTVTNPDSSNDDWYFHDMSARSAYKTPVTYPLLCPGFTGSLQKVYPDTLPDSSGAVSAYDAGPATCRKSMWSHWTGAGADGAGHSSDTAVFGAAPNWWHASYSIAGAVVVDQHGIMVGTLTVDEMRNTPTDFRGAAEVSVSGGGGGGTDITPLIQPLQDIALRDVSYSFNNGGTIFNCRGRVNV